MTQVVTKVPRTLPGAVLCFTRKLQSIPYASHKSRQVIVQPCVLLKT